MSTRTYANAPATTLASSCTALATTIELASTSGLPISYPFILIIDRGGNTEEVVLVTNAAGTTLTVTRGYDSTTAFAHNLGESVSHGIAAIDAREANNHVNAASGVHGATGSVVGTTDTQTLTNKTIGGSNALTGFTGSRFMQSNSDGRIVSGTKAIPTGAVVGTTDTQTLTGKTIDLTDNELTGTTAEFNEALSDDSFATLTGTETLDNKTLTSPTINGIGQVLRAIKSANETVTGSNTLQADDHLTVALPAAGTYTFEFVLFCSATGAGTPDLKAAVNFSGTTTRVKYAGVGAENGSGDQENTSMTVLATDTINTGLTFGLGGTAMSIVTIKGVIVTADAGNLLLRWSQRVSDASNTTINRDSFMRVERIA